METTSNHSADQNQWQEPSSEPQRFSPEEDEIDYRNLDSRYADRNGDDEDESQNDEEDLTDWGSTDPLDAPGNLPDPMDPSGPGSAV